MRKIKFIIITLILFLSLCACTSKEPSLDRFKEIKVGMTPDQVHAILGRPDDTENEQHFEIQYWFEGASSIEDAQQKTNKGKAIKYYCIIFFAEDQMTFKIESKDDILSGTWGKN
ncbi:MAG: hypothetical protein IKT40_04660 [Bacilli bacterium]|jgi:outer membrane protein assembly factor BamE (lipoprotein component of BamABCDE complex)|nr:hypothetical protein [Bacilli bacterium]